MNFDKLIRYRMRGLTRPEEGWSMAPAIQSMVCASHACAFSGTRELDAKGALIPKQIRNIH